MARKISEKMILKLRNFSDLSISDDFLKIVMQRNYQSTILFKQSRIYLPNPLFAVRSVSEKYAGNWEFDTKR